MGLGFESQQDHASNLGAGFLRFTKETPRLFIYTQFVQLNKAIKVYLSTTAKNPICRRCVSSNLYYFSVGEMVVVNHCAQQARVLIEYCGLFLLDSQTLEFLVQPLSSVKGVGEDGDVLRTICQEHFNLYTVVIVIGEDTILRDVLN